METTTPQTTNEKSSALIQSQEGPMSCSDEEYDNDDDYVNLITKDGVTFQVQMKILRQSKTLKDLVHEIGTGEEVPVKLDAAVLEKCLVFMKHHALFPNGEPKVKKTTSSSTKGEDGDLVSPDNDNNAESDNDDDMAEEDDEDEEDEEEDEEDDDDDDDESESRITPWQATIMESVDNIDLKRVMW